MKIDKFIQWSMLKILIHYFMKIVVVLDQLPMECIKFI